MKLKKAKVILTLLASILYKYSVSLGSYSGFKSPPMHGDFEAQRHWLEITTNLNVFEWYWYDLEYWGLDYPPLTAYHSYVLGNIAKLIDPSWVALGSSRGLDSAELKLFMRLTALATDLLIYTPALYFWVNSIYNHNSKDLVQQLLLVSLASPAFALVDHGHFQYNSAMLGLSLLAFTFFTKKRYSLGSILFVSALGFKQMALFYALPVFFYLLGQCFASGGMKGIMLFLRLGISVVLAFLALLSPFLTSPTQILQIFHRVFPIARGLYEDKVANFWCAISVLVKMRKYFDLQSLIRLSVISTLLAVLPSCVIVFRSPTKQGFLYSLAIGSLGFFLFSFQVHEKSILLPLMPITLLYSEIPFFSAWFNNIALFTLWPLLKKDGLAIQYLAAWILWNTVTRDVWFKQDVGIFKKVLAMASYGIISSLTVLEMIKPPPSSLPDLYVVLNSIFGCFCFGISYLYLNYKLATLSSSPSSEKVKTE